MDALSRDANVADSEKVSPPPICRKFTHVSGEKPFSLAELRNTPPQSRSGIEWTEGEKQIIREFYPQLGARGCADMLPGRSENSICHAANKLGIVCTNRTLNEKRKVPLRPACLHGMTADEEFTDRWYKVQDRAFCDAMRAHPGERPSSYEFAQNGAGSRR